MRKETSHLEEKIHDKTKHSEGEEVHERRLER